MRILFASDSIRPPWTGVGRAASALLRGLRNRGAHVTAIDWRDNPTAAATANDFVKLPQSAGPLPTARWHFRLLPRVARAGIRHDVLLDPSGYPNATGRHPALAVVVHDLSALRGGYYRAGKRAFFRLFYGRGLRRAALLACVSEATRSDLLQHYPDLDPARAVVLPNPFDSSLRDVPADPLPTDLPRPYALIVGRREHRKNLGTVLDAVARARARHGYGGGVVLAGRAGHGAERIDARIAEPDLRDCARVVDTPPDSTLVALYRNAEALLFCSAEEGFGLPLLEAMEFGVPVVTSDRGALAEVAGDAALTVDPLDADAIARGLVEVTATPSPWIERGIERVRAFDPSRIASRWSDALAELPR